jgi:hypothetical protein
MMCQSSILKKKQTQRKSRRRNKTSERQTEINEELRAIISTTIDSVRAGLQDKECGLIGQIEFDFAVIKTSEVKGGFRFLQIADLSAKHSKECVSRIKFFVIGNKTQIAIKFGGTW